MKLIAMDIFSTDFIVFTLGGTGVSLLELISVLAGLSCVVLAGRNSKYNFWIGYLYNILLFLLFLQQHLYSAMLLQPIAFAINGFGHWRWTHPRTGEQSTSDPKSLKVSLMTWRGRGLLFGAVVVFGTAWGFILSRLGNEWFANVFSPDPTPYMDSFVLMMTLSAQYLSALKKWDCWIVWLLVNIANIILYISAGLVFMPIVSALYLLNGLWSLYTWYRLYEKEND
ncbi:MAG: nicotinamide riboside transporter PnuC [Bacteroidales bacterium]|jgi:nicotinamide mononucleotide transporter|nr:nicotinamide riboside transporter PnuC [Bacteroidales bacterium]MCI1784726.1 nicotinamide riboside transporter PnuC [Bacteroidales bacterium]